MQGVGKDFAAHSCVLLQPVFLAISGEIASRLAQSYDIYNIILSIKINLTAINY